MHLPPKQDLALKAVVILLVGAVAFAGASRMRPDAPLRIETLTPKQTVVKAETESASPAPVVPPTQKIVVDVAGEVLHRGTVTLPEDARAEDAIKAAGGMKPTADADAVNLAARLADGDQVYVPPKSRPKSTSSKRTRTTRSTTRGSKRARSTKVKLPLDPVAPKPRTMDPAVAAVLNYDLDAQEPPSVVQEARDSMRDFRSAPLNSGPSSAKTSGKVDLNFCKESDLLTVPGIGPSTAHKIIAYRRLKGRIAAIEDLLEIPGIGPKKLEKMRPYFRL